MDKKTIPELAAMSGEEVRAYLVSLPEVEQKAFDEELNKALEVTTSKHLVDHPHERINSHMEWDGQRRT